MKRIALFWAACCGLLFPLSAQESRDYEIGARTSYGLSLKKAKANNYSFDLFGGYKINDHLSAGIGVNYVTYQGRLDLPSGIEDVFIWTENYQTFRPFVYALCDFIPSRKWTPYAGVRLGYAFFRKSSLHYTVFAGSGSAYDPIDMSEYEYLKDLDHTLGVKGNFYGAIDVGISRHIGTGGSKFSFGAYLDVQPAIFVYYKHTERRTNITAGPRIGFTF